MARARVHRQVDVIAFASTPSAICQRARVDGVIPLLVQRDRQNVIAVIIDRLGPIAVVFFPVAIL